MAWVHYMTPVGCGQNLRALRKNLGALCVQVEHPPTKYQSSERKPLEFYIPLILFTSLPIQTFSMFDTPYSKSHAQIW